MASRPALTTRWHTESFIYNLDGTLKESIDKNGSHTHLTYDYERRPLTKKIFSPEGDLLDSSSNTYDAFHLLSTTNFLGHTTTYTYDLVGRKSSVKTGDALTTFEYDCFDQLRKSREFYGENPDEVIINEWDYDLLGRVSEERIVNPNGKLVKKTKYNYDEAGNKQDILQYDEEGLFSTTTILYDPLNRPIELIDAEGNSTTIHYDLKGFNKKGERILIKTTTDPLGNRLVETHDTLGRVVEITGLNSVGVILSNTRNVYDFCNNLVRVHHDVYSQGELIREVVNTWEYDSQNRVICLIEAAGTPDQKITHTHYNSKGQKELIIKPDGVTLTHLYDGLGRLSELFSSDKTIHYSYTSDDGVSHPILSVRSC